MAIYTRFGTEIKITGYNHNTGAIEIEYPSGTVDQVSIFELKATDGIEEIENEIKQL